MIRGSKIILDVIPVADDVGEGNFGHPILLPRPSPTYIGIVGSECNTSEVMETESLFYC